MNIINNFKVARGYDIINIKILKNIAPYILLHLLTHILNLSLQRGVSSDKFIIVMIKPLNKVKKII